MLTVEFRTQEKEGFSKVKLDHTFSVLGLIPKLESQFKANKWNMINQNKRA